MPTCSTARRSPRCSSTTTCAIRSFTPAAKDLFRLVESDTGRPITHVRARFRSDTVQEDAERVMRTLVDHRTPDRKQRQRRALHHAHDALPHDRQRDRRRGHHVRRRHADHRRGDAHRRADGGPAQPPAEPGDAARSPADRHPDRRGRPGRPGSRQPLWRPVAGRERRGRRRRRTRPARPLRIFQGDRELPADEQPLHRAAHSGHAVSAFEGQIQRARRQPCRRHDVGDTDVRRPGQAARVASRPSSTSRNGVRPRPISRSCSTSCSTGSRTSSPPSARWPAA